MSKLLVKPQAPDAEGRIHEVTPETAGWEHVGFAVYKLVAGQNLSRQTGDREHCLVLLSGKVSASVGGKDFGVIGGRTSPFEPDPWSLYVPAGSNWSVTAQGPCELAICSAPGKAGVRPARVIAPADVGALTRGEGSNTRHVRNILPETESADGLLVVEVITPSGCWSSYPPHKHDQDNLPAESLLEETYYPPAQPAAGFRLPARLYRRPLARRDHGILGRRRGVGAEGLSPGRRAAWLRALLSQRHGRAEADLEIPQRSRA